MNNLEKLQQMMELQDKLNTIINPNWTIADYNWVRAAWIECAELMNHMGWKWWKKQQPDLTQAHIELADIFHFLLSEAIVQEISTVDLYYSYQHKDEFNYADNFSDLEVIEYFTYLLLEAINGEMSQDDFYACFFYLMVRLKLSFDELYILYVSKNVLNIFRQECGYKQGTYYKQWYISPSKAIEDNQVLASIVEQINVSEIDNLYEYLYKQLENKYANSIMFLNYNETH